MQESFQHRNEKNNIQEKLEISMVIIVKAYFLFMLYVLVEEFQIKVVSI